MEKIGDVYKNISTVRRVNLERKKKNRKKIRKEKQMYHHKKKYFRL